MGGNKGDVMSTEAGGGPAATAGPEARRLAAGPEARRLAAGPEARRLAAGPEARRLAAGPEARRLAAGPEARRLAAGPEALACRGVRPRDQAFGLGTSAPTWRNTQILDPLGRSQSTLERLAARSRSSLQWRSRRADPRRLPELSICLGLFPTLTTIMWDWGGRG
ncbi:hypothetical protein SRHO_G00096040 [Serrasalmus rhombeus]